MNTIQKSILLQKRRWRIRKKIKGTTARPRLCVHFSGKHVYAQAIDDVAGSTIVSVTPPSTLRPSSSAPSSTAGQLRTGSLRRRRS